MLVKAISASENLAVADRTWAVLREQGAIVEEAVEGEEDDEEEEGGVDEKGEKVVGLDVNLGMRGEVHSEKIRLHEVHPEEGEVEDGGQT